MPTYVNWYVVAGELDGDKLARDAVQLDRYMKPNTDITVVEYQGRGYEPFGDEIQRMFEWMGLKQRKMPKEIDCVSMRPWDNFFWWLEVEGLPPKSMVAPANWPPPRTVRPAQIEGKRLETNKVTVKVQADKVTVWLSPELVDFNQKLVVEVNGRAITPRDRTVRPDSRCCSKTSAPEPTGSTRSGRKYRTVRARSRETRVESKTSNADQHCAFGSSTLDPAPTSVTALLYSTARS